MGIIPQSAFRGYTSLVATLDSIAVSQADLDFVADGRGGYAGVYAEKGGAWSAKAFKRRVCGAMPTPRAAAAALVRWWKRRYGARWRSVWAYRQAVGWKVRRVRGGWVACVWVEGRAWVVLGVGPGGAACEVATTPGARPFGGKRAAAEGVAEWAAGRWGCRWGEAVRRGWAESHGAARLTPVPVAMS